MGFTSAWIVLAALGGIVSIPRGIHGACLYQGTLFENNSSWKPDSCHDCSCLGDIVVCTTTRCPKPQCDFQKGEWLRITPGKCCPECVPQSQFSCLHEGKTYGPDSQWHGSNCSVCTCLRGRVSCTPRPCATVHCRRDERPVINFGECCAKCEQDGNSCFLNASSADP
ncbi:extracellular matrix protein FRAS1-like [Megalops cyprinoides]|uniref:extracellular matrix protein FRAS1-like n=1 Tax=Megalops cyprinoides TaxID=118141 RepID=UPI0018651956|nr:extracellular matrix protein FRAS1-like [Megalops cyprinoides]